MNLREFLINMSHKEYVEMEIRNQNNMRLFSCKADSSALNKFLGWHLIGFFPVTNKALLNGADIVVLLDGDDEEGADNE